MLKTISNCYYFLQFLSSPIYSSLVHSPWRFLPKKCFEYVFSDIHNKIYYLDAHRYGIRVRKTFKVKLRVQRWRKSWIEHTAYMNNMYCRKLAAIFSFVNATNILDWDFYLTALTHSFLSFVLFFLFFFVSIGLLWYDMKRWITSNNSTKLHILSSISWNG